MNNTIFSASQSQEKDVHDIEINGKTSQSLLCASVLQTGEVLQKDQTYPYTELQVYTIRTHTKGKDLHIFPTQDQPNSLRDGPENIPCILTSIVPFNNELIDLDIPIATRKGV